jgi:polysaccharide transporter, PST family
MDLKIFTSRASSNVSWLLIDSISRSAVVFIVGVLIARHLGPSELGKYAFVMAILMLFQSISSLGINEPLIKKIAQNGDRGGLINAATFIYALSGLMSFFLFLLVALGLRDKFEELVIYAMLMGSTLLLKPFDIVKVYNESQVLSKFTVYAQLTGASLISLIRVFLIYLGVETFYFVVAFLIEMVLISIFLCFYSRRNFDFYIPWRTDFNLVVNLIKDGFPLLLSGIAIMINMRVDQIMLGFLTDSRDVGLYSVAVKFSEIPILMITVVLSTFFPILARSYKYDRGQFNRELSILSGLTFWFTVGLIGVVIFISGFLVNSLLGSEYSQSINVIKIYVFSCIAVAIGVVWTKWIILEGRAYLSAYAQGIAAVLNIFCNSVFIPKYGIEGAALATVFAYSVSVFISLFFHRARFIFNSICLGIFCRWGKL